MVEKDFRKLVKNIDKCLDFLRTRRVGTTTIHEWLLPAYSVPKQWDLLYQTFEALEYGEVNEDIVTAVHRILRDKIDIILQYDNKLVQILEPLGANTYKKLYTSYKKSHTEKLSDFSTSDLLHHKRAVKVTYNMGKRFESFATKSLIKEKIKVDITDRVDASIKSQYEDVYGLCCQSRRHELGRYSLRCLTIIIKQHLSWRLHA